MRAAPRAQRRRQQAPGGLRLATAGRQARRDVGRSRDAYGDYGGYDEPDPGAYPDAGRGGPAGMAVAGGPTQRWDAPGGSRAARWLPRRRQPRRPSDSPAPRRLDPYDEQERVLIALMLALGKPGREQLAALDLEDLRVAHVRAVAAWFQANGDEGGQLPDDDALAEVARDIVIRSARSTRAPRCSRSRWRSSNCAAWSASSVRPAANASRSTICCVRRTRSASGSMPRWRTPWTSERAPILRAR